MKMQATILSEKWASRRGSHGLHGQPAFRWGRSRTPAQRGVVLFAVFALCLACTLFVPPVYAQQPRHSKLPGIGKIASNGSTKAAFTGIVQIVDARSKVLEVSSADGKTNAIFPIGKKVKISTIEGRKLKLADLEPGANIVVNYQQSGGRRTVQEITVLSNRPVAHSSKKKNPPPKASAALD